MSKKGNLALVMLILSTVAWNSAVECKERAGPSSVIIPETMDATERRAFLQAANLLSRSNFDGAARLLKPLTVSASTRVHVSYAAVKPSDRAQFQAAVRRALAGWNAASGTIPRLNLTPRETDADLHILFEKDVASISEGPVELVCSDMRMDSFVPPPYAPTRRLARLRIAVCIPYSELVHPPRSITHLVSKGIGSYLGLALTRQPVDLMGPDTHTAEVAVRPSAADLQNARMVDAIRQRLIDHARRRIPIGLPSPIIVLDKAEIDAGDISRGDTHRFEFAVRNTGQAPLEITAKPNCNCVIPAYNRTIPPGGTGSIVAEMHTESLRGPTTRLIEVNSNDPNKPQLYLRLIANVKSVLEILPTETPILGLNDEGATVKEFQIRSTGAEPLEIRRVTCSAPYVQVESARLPPSAGQGQAHRLGVTIRPEAPQGRSSFLITVSTASLREPSVTLNVVCEKGVLVAPPSLYLGAVQPSPAKPLIQFVTLHKRSGSFLIRSIRSEDPKLEVAQETVREGSEYRIKFTYRGGWVAGALRTRAVVDTDDKYRPSIEIPIVASVAEPVAAR